MNSWTSPMGAETGLYYYNARYYNPGLGRFVSADSIVPDPEDPQAFNRYSYTLNNPVIYTDPTGNEVQLYATLTQNKYYDSGPSISISSSSSWYYTPSFYRPAPAPVRSASAPKPDPAPAPVRSSASTSTNNPTISNTQSAHIAGLVADTGIGFTPAGVWADIYGAATGYSLFGGQELSGWERGLGLIPGFSEVAGVVRGVRTTKHLVNAKAFEGVPLETFEGLPRTRVLKSDVLAYRYSGGVSDPRGRFLTTWQTLRQINEPEDALRVLQLPVGATAEKLNTWVIPKGTEIFIGRVKGGPVGATQIFTKDAGVLK